MANSKKKGNKAERELCKFWEQWTDYKFTRVPASGGLRWKNTNATAGDIICDHEIHSRRFQFSVESKSYKDINFEHILLGNKKCDVLKFWQQCNDDAERSNKVPILFMRYNGMNKNTYFVIIPIYVHNLFFPGIYSFQHNKFIVHGPNPMVIMNSNDLLQINYLKLHKDLKQLRRNGQETQKTNKKIRRN
jgi:hypothetical protein